MAEREHVGRATEKAIRSQAISRRILDTAASLLERLGYAKITMEDIARGAQVSKATVYLRWKTREELFGVLLRRERAKMAEEIQQSIGADPVGASLQGIFKHTALALLKNPVMKAIFLRDTTLLGNLVHHEQSNAAYRERIAGFEKYLTFLRERKLIRTDISLQAQMYLMSSVFSGFFLIAPLMPDGYTLADEELANLLAETICSTLEIGVTVNSEDAEQASQAFRQYLERVVEILHQQSQQDENS